MMDNLIAKDLIEAHGVVGIWKCKRKGDDIEVTESARAHSCYSS